MRSPHVDQRTFLAERPRSRCAPLRRRALTEGARRKQWCEVEKRTSGPLGLREGSPPDHRGATGHDEYEPPAVRQPPIGRHAPRTACAAIPRRSPTGAGGVAAGDTAASTVNTTVPPTGDRDIVGSCTHAATPTATSKTS